MATTSYSSIFFVNRMMTNQIKQFHCQFQSLSTKSSLNGGTKKGWVLWKKTLCEALFLKVSSYMWPLCCCSEKILFNIILKYYSILLKICYLDTGPQFFCSLCFETSSSSYKRKHLTDGRTICCCIVWCKKADIVFSCVSGLICLNFTVFRLLWTCKYQQALRTF